MSEFIRIINEADKLVELHKQARLTLLELLELLIALGFDAADIESTPIVCEYQRIKIELCGP